MEVLGLITLPGWFVVITALCLSLLMYTFYKQSVFRRLGVPGPWPIPFLGILPTIISKGFLNTDLYHVKKYGKVFGEYIGNIPSLVVSDVEMVKQICVKNFSNFQDRARDFPAEKYFDHSVLQAEGERWKFLRSALSPTFSSGKMRNMNPLIQRCTASLLEVLKERVKQKEAVDMLLVYQAFSMDVICTTAFGIDVDAQLNPRGPFVENARKAFDRNITKSPKFLITMFFPDLRPLVELFGIANKQALVFFRDTSRDVIQARKKSDAAFRDLVQLMVNAHESDDKDDVDETEKEATKVDNNTRRGLTDDEMLANSIIFMMAGYETTAVSLTMATHNLTAYPGCQDKLIAEIDKILGREAPTYDSINKLPYLEMVINETLRLYTPGFRFNRRALQDIEICGQFIPKGMAVTVPVYAIHRDERYWPDPEKFDPERFSPDNKDNLNLNAYMPFGFGPRMCVGMRLAVMEIKMALVTLLQNYRFKPAPAFKIPPDLVNGLPKPAEGSVTVYLESRSKDGSW